jgi:hypothetical protein
MTGVGCQVPGDRKEKLPTPDTRYPTLAMTPKEIAAHYEAKVFDTPEAAKVAGFVLTETMAPRNVWNKASAAQALVLKLVEKRTKGEVEEIGLVIEPWSVTGCYKPVEAETPAA